MFTPSRMVLGSSIAQRQSCVPWMRPSSLWQRSPPIGLAHARHQRVAAPNLSTTIRENSTVSTSTAEAPNPDLKGLLEHAAREHVQSQNSRRVYSWASDKRPSGLWVIEGETPSATNEQPNPSTNSQHAWIFKRISGSTPPCDFDTECRVDRK